MRQPEPRRGTDVADLVHRCARADPEAWEEFVRRFNRRLLLYAVRMNSLPPACDRSTDLLQDVYLRLVANDYRALRAWRGDSEQSFLNYLATIVHAVACDSLKRERSRKRAVRVVSLDTAAVDGGISLADLLPAPEADSPERGYAERAATERLRAALARAERGPQGRRNGAIFRLHVLEGLTANEIAHRPDIAMSTANVESAIRRTRERLRFALATPQAL